MKRRLYATGMLVLAAAMAPARAEMEAGDYQVRESLGSPEEQERARRQIEAEIEAERQRAAERAAAEQADAAAAAARWAALPPDMRRLKTRCTVCHADENYAGKAYGWLGWQAVILRMQWLNGAALEPGDRDALARHLADTRPAPLVWRLIEWLVALGPPATALALALHWLQRRRRRH